MRTPGFPAKHHSRLAAMSSPSVAPKLHPAALSPADVALFPTTTPPGAVHQGMVGSHFPEGQRARPFALSHAYFMLPPGEIKNHVSSPEAAGYF